MRSRELGTQEKYGTENRREMLAAIHRVLKENTDDCRAFAMEIDEWLIRDQRELHAKYRLTPIKIAGMLRYVKDDQAPKGWEVTYAGQQWTIKRVRKFR
jgi:hypothetical protein